MKQFFWNRVTKCDSGHTLNVLMHPFLLLTTVLAIAFLGFGDTASVQAMVLYQNTDFIFGWSLFGLAAAGAMIAHSIAFLVRGAVGKVFMPIAMFLGFFAWLYASLLYLGGGFYFQFLILCVPNLWFWVWYSINFRRRYRGEYQAFVK